MTGYEKYLAMMAAEKRGPFVANEQEWNEKLGFEGKYKDMLQRFEQMKDTYDKDEMDRYGEYLIALKAFYDNLPETVRLNGISMHDVMHMYHESTRK